MKTTPVTISVDANSIVVNPPVVVLSKKKKDQVEWKTSSAKLNFLVCFGNRSPFQHKHFMKQRSKSGVVKVQPCEPEEYFKYSVEVDGITLDPGVVVKP